jgi:CRISPR-associated protein Cmr1
MRSLPKLSALEAAIAAVEHSQSAPDFTTLQYEVELITPMLGGGVVAGETDTAMPFRARSLRGHFRTWWRILARGGVLKFAPGSRPESDGAWRDLEISIWGGLTEPVRASEVGLHVFEPRNVQNVNYITLNSRPMDYVLFGAKANNSDLVAAGAKFSLTVTVKQSHLVDQVKAVIRYWATFGGIGSRTSRGLGAIRAFLIESGQASPYLCALPFQILDDYFKTPARNGKSFSVGNGTLQLFIPAGAVRDADLAHRQGIMQLRDFRQQPGLARDVGPGISRWSEANTIRLASGSCSPGHDPEPKTFHGLGFAPRADFGLPIRIWFKDGPGDRATADRPFRDPLARNLLPSDLDSDRMASPLILRPVTTPAGRFFSVAILINRQALEGAAASGRARWRLPEVRLDPPAGPTDRLPVWTTGLSTGPGGSGPLAAYRSGEAFKDAQSAVEAFLNYFMSRGV